ncbi:MAG: DUF4831 family protein [Bacteroidales bacterium]|jgi:hypothetical protein|nr:DUF4831 family protein [Bacteroidales bacterium]MDD2617243.1 DUF4831 family protein [Bacteroidales bacterium]MDD4640318.1 DUF4831 family protein [Bacteroidales bacterium]NLB02325.1 DUF4831 family protein [Bacteroidales bacterium]
MKKQLFLLILLLGISGSLTAQIQSRIVEGPIPYDAFSYHLPKTVFQIRVTSKTIHEEPGIYARYSERLLGISDIITTEKLSNELVSLELDTYTVPDHKRVYYIQAVTPQVRKKRAESAQTPELNLQFSPEGILCAVNMEASSTKVYSGKTAQAKAVTPCPENAKENSTSSALSIHTQDMQLSGSSIRMAELAAKQIFELRETRLSLIQGELNSMPQDGASLERMLTELNRMEWLYTELFTGTRKQSIQTQVIEYTPDKIPSYEVLFRFSTQKGIVDKDDLSGYPVHFLVHNPETDVINQQEDSTDKIGNEIPEKTCGLYYYRPNRVGISVLKGQEILYRDNFVVAQFGDLMELPSSEKLMVELDPETGAIVRFKNR